MNLSRALARRMAASRERNLREALIAANPARYPDITCERLYRSRRWTLIVLNVVTVAGMVWSGFAIHVINPGAGVGDSEFWLGPVIAFLTSGVLLVCSVTAATLIEFGVRPRRWLAGVQAFTVGVVAVAVFGSFADAGRWSEAVIYALFSVVTAASVYGTWQFAAHWTAAIDNIRAAAGGETA
ncbi:hypothetical protein [Nocardia sp. alder85J]|uniref:hypothetical protein n=1 Tax=Nocardia sp. alder85J TaxID=2862949 RepID=UPI001CD31EF8|nr:hypothetical protein [Nocardia sp. alder85J]MCX4099265.1 hypothetical protein [Nocardia sp. alder85J]